MHIGIQLHAPDGFETLQPRRVYHLLINDARRGRVLMVNFVQKPMRDTVKAKSSKRWTPTPFPVLHVVRRKQFEDAILDGRIARVDPQADLPPWLNGLSSALEKKHDAPRAELKRSHKERIDSRLQHITPLIERLDDVLRSDDPLRAIKQYARACTPRQNETRFCSWFLSYLCFGSSRTVLHYPVHRIGHWDRLDHSSRKFGRPSSVRGAFHGFGSNDPEMQRKIEEGYRRFSDKGVHLSSIFRTTMREIFGCKERPDGFNKTEFYHPDGEPFPTEDQFLYHVRKRFPLAERQRTKYGHERARNEMSVPIGHFYQSVGSVMERVEADGYCVAEVARGYKPGSHLPPLIVVRLRCQASGALVGIGFSVGGERASAYRMAKFCMAIDKVRFCALFGETIEPEKWPCIGQSPNEIVDRGPGRTAGARAQGGAPRPMFDEATPSYSAQSKAIIESSNPREVRLEGQPTYVITKLTIPQLAWHEINRTLRSNNASDVSSRLNNEAIIDDVPCTPIGVWNYLTVRGRTYAIPMQFEDAVRAFLTRIDLKASEFGVVYLGQVFDSPALRETGLHQRVASSQKEIVVKGYMLDVCVRHLWVELDGALIQVDAMMAISAGEEQLYISVVELEQIAQLRKQGRREWVKHTQAERSYWERRFEEETGVAADQGQRRRGKAKRGSKASIDEQREVMPYLRAGKGAK